MAAFPAREIRSMWHRVCSYAVPFRLHPYLRAVKRGPLGPKTKRPTLTSGGKESLGPFRVRGWPKCRSPNRSCRRSGEGSIDAALAFAFAVLNGIACEYLGRVGWCWWIIRENDG